MHALAGLVERSIGRQEPLRIQSRREAHARHVERGRGRAAGCYREHAEVIAVLQLVAAEAPDAVASSHAFGNHAVGIAERHAHACFDALLLRVLREHEELQPARLGHEREVADDDERRRLEFLVVDLHHVGTRARRGDLDGTVRLAAADVAWDRAVERDVRRDHFDVEFVHLAGLPRRAEPILQLQAVDAHAQRLDVARHELERGLLVAAEHAVGASAQALLRQRRDAHLRVGLHRAPRQRAVGRDRAVVVAELRLQQTADRMLRARTPIAARMLADAALVLSLRVLELLLLLQHRGDRAHGFGVAAVERIGAPKREQPPGRSRIGRGIVLRRLHREAPLCVDDRALHAFPVGVRGMLREVVPPGRERRLELLLRNQHVAAQCARERSFGQRRDSVLCEELVDRTQRIVAAARARIATRNEERRDARLLVLRESRAKVAQRLHCAIDPRRRRVGHAERQRHFVGRIPRLRRVLAEREKVSQHRTCLRRITRFAQRLAEQQHRLALALVDREFLRERREPLHRVLRLARCT